MNVDENMRIDAIMIILCCEILALLKNRFFPRRNIKVENVRNEFYKHN